MASNIHVEKLAIFSANAETDEWQIREYIAQNWWTLTKELKQHFNSHFIQNNFERT